MSVPTAPFALLVYRHLAGWFATGSYGAFAVDDEANDWFLANAVTAMCKPLEVAYAAFAGAAWVNPAATPDEFVEWLSVALGVDTRGASLPTLRGWIPTGGPTRQRGGDEAIVLRVKQVLTGTKTVRISRRTDPAFAGVDKPWNTLIRVRADEAPRTPNTLGGQLFANTSFESNLSGWDIDGGEFAGNPSVVPTRVADAGTSSGFAMQVVAAAGGTGYEGAETNAFTTVAGQRYTAEGYVKKTGGAGTAELFVGQVGGATQTATVLQTLATGYEEHRIDFVASGTSYRVGVREAGANTGVTFRLSGVTVRAWNPESVLIAAARDRAAPVWQRVHAQVLTGAAIDELSGPISGLTGNIEGL